MQSNFILNKGISEMDNEDREASPEPSSSHLCENSVDDYLSAEGASSGVIDSSHLFGDTYDEEENFVESQSKSPANSSQYELIPFEESYSYNEAIMACQVGQSNFNEQSNIYECPSHSKATVNDFSSMEVDDNQPGSSSGTFSHCEMQNIENDSSGFEPTSNQSRSVDSLNYSLVGFDKAQKENAVNLNASSSKQPDSSLFDRNKGFGKNKSLKGKGKGKGKCSKNLPSKGFNIKSSKAREYRVESSNKHSLFAIHSPEPNNNTAAAHERLNGQNNISDDENEIEDSVNTSSQCDFLTERNDHIMNEEESYVVASSSEGVNVLQPMLDLKSPTTPGDSCMVSSSTGQLDSLPPTPINFQGNDASHSSPVSSPVNPPVLDSTVDSTSGQNLLSSYCEDDEGSVRSDNELEFGCSLEEERNEISTSVSHLQDGVDSQELNMLVETQEVYAEQQPNDGHFVAPFMSLDSLHTSSLHSSLNDEKNNDETASALIPTSSAYLPDSLEMPGSSHMSEESKRILYKRRKEVSYNSIDASNSGLGSASLPLNSINPISFSEEGTLTSCNSEGSLSHIGLMDLGISEMEPESSSLVASSANLDSEDYPPNSSANDLSSSESNFESSTLAQLNHHYLLGIGENSLSSEDVLSPESVSNPGPEMIEGSLGLREKEEDSLGSSDNEGTSNLHASLELGLGPQQLRRLIGSQQEPEPQSLVPPTHLLEEANNAEPSENVSFLVCSNPIPGTSDRSNPNATDTRNSLNKTKHNQVLNALESEESSGSAENPFIIMVSEAESLPSSHLSAFGTLPSREKVKPNTEILPVKSPTLNEISLTESLESSCSPKPMSSSHKCRISEKENVFRIPNGMLGSSSTDTLKKFSGTQDKNASSQASQSSEFELEKKKVPINIYSLFDNQHSAYSGLNKPLTSYSVNEANDHQEPLSLASLQDKENIEEDQKKKKQNSDNFSIDYVMEEPASELEAMDDHEASSQHFLPSKAEKNDQEEPISMGNKSEKSYERENSELTDNNTQSSSEINSGRNCFWCADCEQFLKAKCSLHRIQTIMDKPVLTRAWASLPAQHLTIKLIPVEKDGGCNGVFTRKNIPKRTQFGPLEGRFVTEPPPPFGLRFKSTQGSVEGFIDISEEGSSNWMRFVRAATSFTQMNCVVIEEENFIYFLTTTNLPSKMELRVGYSKQYAIKYGLPLLVPTEEEKALLQKNLTCETCNITFSAASELEQHAAMHKKDDQEEQRPRRRVKPKGLKQGSPQPPRVVKRIKVNRKSSLSEVAELFSASRKGGREIYECLHCELCFHDHEVLRLHALGHPLLLGAPPSDEARVGTEQGSSRYTHEEHHRLCPSCSKSCATMLELIEHVLSHSFLLPKSSTELRSLKCELCYKSFYSAQRLKGHMETHRNDKERTFACYHCASRFCNKSALGSHLKLHIENDGTKVYDCPICQEKFYSVNALKSHLPGHCVSGEYTCPTCSKTFVSYHKIRRHIRSYHSAVHPCLQCDKRLPSIEKLKVHLLSHSDRRDFPCPVCQKCFKRKDKMKDHIKRIHSVKREPNNNNNNHANYSNKKKNSKFIPKVDPSDYKMFVYKCHLCLLGFKRRGMLVNHLSKRHPSIPLSSIPELNQPILRTSRSYICQYCGKAYVSSTKRKLHILKNHPGAELPPPQATMGGEAAKTTRTYAASCPWCPRQYATKAKLLQHQRYHHGLTKDDQSSEGRRGQGTEADDAAASKSASSGDIFKQTSGKLSEKAQLVKVEHDGGAPSVLELRVEAEGPSRQSQKQVGARAPGSLGDQVLVSPFLLPHEGSSYALLTPEGGESFTLALRPGQIIPSVGGFSVLSETSTNSEGTNPGPSARLLDANTQPAQLALDLHGIKGESCVVAQVGGETPSPVLVWQSSLSFAPSS